MAARHVIEVEDVHKRYRLGTLDRTLLADEIRGTWSRLMGRPDPRALIDHSGNNQRQGEYFWSLRGVSFAVEQGEVLGIIGHNGAGKSTLLKLLSRITLPTSGVMRIRGRVTSLLEVGTGFHNELTGRENIYLNGAIMGMRRAAIDRLLEEIIEFSGITDHIDTPIKRYSSGMKVRLGFAVAAHLDPDILILDEVLAVGDADFQRKCLGKMKEVSTKEGRTVIFVSHNLAAVKSLCHRALLLDHGVVTFAGDTTSTVSHYLKGRADVHNLRSFGATHETNEFKLVEVGVCPAGSGFDVLLDDNHSIELHLKIDMKRNGPRRRVNLALHDEQGTVLFTMNHAKSDVELRDGMNHLVCTFPAGFLNVGGYFLSIWVFENANTQLFHEHGFMTFEVQQGQREIGRWMGREPGFIKPVFPWRNEVVG